MSSSEWREVRLTEVCDYISRGITPSYTEKNDVVVINQKCIRDNCVSLNQSRYTDSQKKKIPVDKYLVRNDILVNSTGVGTLGRVAQIREIKSRITTDSHVTIVRPNNTVNSTFVGYNLFLQQSNIEALAEGSTGQTELSRVRLGEAIKLLIPPLPEQKAIAATLSCLDNKIELNNKMNKTLEEMAQAIFKNWFVDFEFPNENGEPYKSSGGDMVDSELGLIPKGWRVGTLGEMIEKTIAGDWGKENPQGNYSEEVICIRGADIPEIAIGKKGKPPTRFILTKNLENKNLSSDQIIIEISGGSPTQSTGRTAFVSADLLKSYKVPIICTNFCRAISFKKKEFSSFVYSLIQYLYEKKVLFLYENGTTGIKNLDTNNLFGQYKIIIPSNKDMSLYYEIFNILIKSIYKTGQQTETLNIIRDSLLPKLMSGEIRVPLEEVN